MQEMCVSSLETRLAVQGMMLGIQAPPLSGALAAKASRPDLIRPSLSGCKGSERAGLQLANRGNCHQQEGPKARGHPCVRSLPCVGHVTWPSPLDANSTSMHSTCNNKLLC